METVSIVIPVYNVEKYLKRCVDSVLTSCEKLYKECRVLSQIILVDDGSPDNSPSICDDYENAVFTGISISVIHQKNGGLSSARNTGIQHAIGEWISFIDSDDYVHEDYFYLLYRALQETNADVSICNYVNFSDTSPIPNETKITSISEITTEDFWVLHRICATTAWCKIYRKSLFSDVSYPIGKLREDEYTTYKILFQNKTVAYVDSQLYYYYQNEKSISRMRYIDIMKDSIEAFKLQYKYFADSIYPKAFETTVIEYASAIAYGIEELKNYPNRENQIKELNLLLRSIIKKHKNLIPLAHHKFIFIAAYPKQQIAIRIVGYIIEKLER